MDLSLDPVATAEKTASGMRTKHLYRAYALILAGLISHHICLTRNILLQDRHERRLNRVGFAGGSNS